MVFSNLVFLFAFLPAVIVTYYIVPKQAKNLLLLAASLLFYAWGEPKYIFLMIVSILMNYTFGRLIHFYSEKQQFKRATLILTIIGNISLLGFYKYGNFLIDNLNAVFGWSLANDPIPLPIGISFFTFQAMSYIIDVYRNDAKVQKNFWDLALYISLFPQLVAGPIVRYNTIADQIKNRVHHMGLFASGVRQFIIGLSKKIILANPLGEIADTVFAIDPGNMSTTTAWIGILAYTLQIYFDFSGYSDMAIGLGKMFGFKFLENFNYPYIAKSISDFWRRWHISLSTWFRDYIYIPLGGNRKGLWKTYRNILIVWTITGFWHGASWTFMAWGFYYGVIISIERAGLGTLLNKLWRPLQHVYVLIIVMIGWVFFRADNFAYSFEFIQTLFSLQNGPMIDGLAQGFLHDKTYLFILALFFSLPVYPWVIRKLDDLQQSSTSWKAFLAPVRNIGGPLVYFTLLLFITMLLVNSTYNPFIYFRF